MLKELVLKSRSCRRFSQKVPVSEETLKELVGLARLCPSGANKQPLKYILSNEPEKNSCIFPALAWAGYLAGWPGPAEGERPAAYIIILNDTDISESPGCDHGIAAQAIMLGAAEKGLGGCIIGSIQHGKLRKTLKIPERYTILLVAALGRPAEEVVLEDVGADGDIKYYRDEGGVHRVPKRSLEEIILPF